MARLKDYSSFDDSTEVVSLEDIEEREVTIQSVQFVEGSYGKYCFMNVLLPEGNEVRVMTGGRFIIEALEKAQAEGAFPVDATFVKKGRAWLFE
jgi:hypothetical protein